MSRFQHRLMVFFSAGAAVFTAAVEAVVPVLAFVFRTRTVDLAGLSVPDLVGA
jgi:hypothetical protein